MKNFGFTLRILRESKNMSINELSTGILSKSNLSKYERGEIDMSVSKLLLVLDKLNISLSEFQTVSKRQQDDSLNSLFQEINTAYETESIISLKSIWSSESKKYNDTFLIKHKLNFIMIEALLYDLSEDPFYKNNVKFITDYLFSCEVWGNYEMILYGNCLSIMKHESMIILSKEISQKISLFKNIQTNYETSINILVNTIILCIEHGDERNALILISQLKNEKIPEHFLLENVIFNYTIGLYLIKFSDPIKGLQQCEKYLSIFKLTGATNYYIKFKTYLEKLVSSTVS